MNLRNLCKDTNYQIGIKQVSLVLCFGSIILLYNVASSIRIQLDASDYVGMIVSIALTIVLYLVIRKSWQFASFVNKEKEKKEEVLQKD